MIDILSNYIKIAYRNLGKNKSYSLINITGLGIGIACSLLILLYVKNETSYDRFHSKADQIYRVPWRFHVGVNEFDSALAPCPLAAAMRETFPEVLAATRIYSISLYGGNVYLRYQDKQFSEKKFIWADSTIFDVFDIKVLAGDPATALNAPNSVMITPAAARKYFGKDNPLGKMLTFEDGSVYKVTAVAADFPPNSQLHFDFMASFSSLAKSRDPDWYDTAVLTYIVLPPDYPQDQLQAKLDRFARQNAEPVIKMITGLNWDEFLANGHEYSFHLEALTAIHLNSRAENNLEPGGNRTTIFIFTGIAVIILLVACINFINLTISRSVQRGREIGVRKVFGSSRRQLVFQHLIESTVMCLLAILLAIPVDMILLSLFNRYLALNIPFTLFLDPQVILGLAIGAIVLGAMAGFYPAWILSASKPIQIFKSKSMSTSSGVRFRNALVITQFVASIVLIIGTLVIYNQLRYFQNKDLGFNKDQVVVIQNAEAISNRQAFKNSLLDDPNISSATFTDCLPLMRLEVKVFEKGADNQKYTLITLLTDYDFKDTYKINMAEGRFFDKTYPADVDGVILNQAAIKALNITDWSNESLYLLGRKRTPLKIIGVTEDFHVAPLQYEINPMAMVMLRERTPYLLSVRMRSAEIGGTLHHIEQQWSQFVPGQPIDYIFYDDEFGKLYTAEIRAGRLLTVFSFIAVFIACLGLYGMVALTTVQRTKEIGVRKVLGSSVSQIIRLLMTEQIKLIIIANIIAIPLAGYMMNKWLENFAYRTQIGISAFIIAGIGLILVASLTIIWHVARAALANPIKSLRYE